MADRSFHRTETQGVRYVEYFATIAIASGAPVFVEGDKADAAAGSYLTLADTGTGEITVTTVDPFLGSVYCTVHQNKATASLNSVANAGAPTQNSDKTWSVLITTGANSAGTHSAADMSTGDTLSLHWVLRNSAVLP